MVTSMRTSATPSWTGRRYSRVLVDKGYRGRFSGGEKKRNEILQMAIHLLVGLHTPLLVAWLLEKVVEGVMLINFFRNLRSRWQDCTRDALGKDGKRVCAPLKCNLRSPEPLT